MSIGLPKSLTMLVNIYYYCTTTSQQPIMCQAFMNYFINYHSPTVQKASLVSSLFTINLTPHIQSNSESSKIYHHNTVRLCPLLRTSTLPSWPKRLSYLPRIL